jgi:hypothetical protein
MSNTDVQEVWTTGTNGSGPDGSPVCAFTRIELVVAENDQPPPEVAPPSAEFMNGNNARPSALPVRQFGLLTGHYPDYGIGFLTREGAAQLMQEYVWAPELAAVESLDYDQWVTTTTYNVSDIVQDLGLCYIALVGHTSVVGPPPAGNAFWGGYDPSYTVAPWVQSQGAHDIRYHTGSQTTHVGSTWTSIVDNNVWEPGVSQWNEVLEVPDGTWQANVSYLTNDERLYSVDGKDYRCRQGHISQATWTPPATPSLWLEI